MRTEKLEILRYSPNGKVLRRIACLPGFISVFRSRSEVELGFYVDALHLRSAAGVSEIKINKEPASSEQLVYFDSSQDLTAADVSSWLMDIISAGDGQGKAILRRLSDEIKLPLSAENSNFSEQDLKILKLLSLLSQNLKVAVVDDPFDGISEEVIEPLARAMVELVEKSDVIVVVKKLSQRPEAWIENEHVERVQIEAPRQRTIGFGGHHFEIEIPAPRDTIPHHMKLGMSSAMHPALDPSMLPGFKAKRDLLRTTLFTSIIAAVLVVSFVNNTGSKSQTSSNTTSGLNAEGDATSASQSVERGGHGSSNFAANSADENVQLALASYPQDIQIAVTRAFSAPEEELKQLPSFPPTPARRVIQAQNNSGSSGGGDSYVAPEADQLPPQTESDEELAERRARVRQSFLEALARARERLAAERGGQY